MWGSCLLLHDKIKENPHKTCLYYTPGVDSVSSYGVSVTFQGISPPSKRGDNTNIKYRQHLLPLSWQAHAQVVLTEPFLVIFSGTNPAAWCVTSIIRFFSFLHWCSVIYGYQQSGLELPVSFLCLCELTEEPGLTASWPCSSWQRAELCFLAAHPPGTWQMWGCSHPSAAGQPNNGTGPELAQLFLLVQWKGNKEQLEEYISTYTKECIIKPCWSRTTK